jgi:hypothetical protein
VVGQYEEVEGQNPVSESIWLVIDGEGRCNWSIMGNGVEISAIGEVFAPFTVVGLQFWHCAETEVLDLAHNQTSIRCFSKNQSLDELFFMKIVIFRFSFI